MKKIVLLLASLSIFTGCSVFDTPSLPVTHKTASGSAFQLEKNFIVAIAESNQNMPSTLIVAKSDSHFVLYKKDTTSLSVCDNLSNTLRCASTNHLSQDQIDTLMRVSTKTLWRLLGQETTLKDTEVTVSGSIPKFTISDPAKLPQGFKQYFTESSTDSVDTCLTSKKSSEQEAICTWKDITVLYKYSDTSDLPVASVRAIFSYAERDLSMDELQALHTSLLSEIK